MGTNDGRQTNRRWLGALKREIVAAAFAPGASVSVIARWYAVNANQVFNRRRRYLADFEPSSPPPTPALVTVMIAPAPDGASSASSPEPAASETIEIEVSGDYRGKQVARSTGAVVVRLPG
ncbi:MAG: transposase [Hyphomicrobium sp.]